MIRSRLGGKVTIARPIQDFSEVTLERRLRDAWRGHRQGLLTIIPRQPLVPIAGEPEHQCAVFLHECAGTWLRGPAEANRQGQRILGIRSQFDLAAAGPSPGGVY